MDFQKIVLEENEKNNPKLIRKEYIKKSTITALMPLATNLFNS